jgi:hypothetical protein
VDWANRKGSAWKVDWANRKEGQGGSFLGSLFYICLKKGDSHLISLVLISPNTPPPVASTRAVYLHSPRALPLLPPCPYFLFAQTTFQPDPSLYKYRLNSSQVIIHTYPPVKLEPTECSETSAFNIQMPRKYPEENIPHLQHGKSLKTKRTIKLPLKFIICMIVHG